MLFSGQAGQCRMYIWTYTTVSGTSSFEQNFFLISIYILQPNGDGSLKNIIIVYEMTHGITNRMTGGRCLQTTETGGMG